MKATPRMTRAESLNLLPARIAGPLGATGLPQTTTPAGTFDQHGALPALQSDAPDRTMPPGAEAENRAFAARLRTEFNTFLTTIKPNDPPHNQDAGPRFVLVWRMYPNAHNPHVASSGGCGCGCSCGG